MCVFIEAGAAMAQTLDRVNVCGELVKAGNTSPHYIEPLDWSIIILGTHPLLLSLASPLLPRPPLLCGSLHLQVIAAIMTYLALSSAPSSTHAQKHKAMDVHKHLTPLAARPPVALD